ncbi:MAG: ATP-binding response regulator [Anaerolineae bacterium]
MSGGHSAITEGMVRDALAHLYDSSHLQQHPLLRHLAVHQMPDPLARAQHLRKAIIQAIGRLEPPPEVVPRSKEWRPYGVLVYRYLDGMSGEQIQRELAISARQLYRDIGAGVSLLTLALQGQAEPTTDAGRDDLADSLQSVGLHLETLDLGVLCQQAVALLSGLAATLGRGIRLDPPRAPVLVSADVELSRQALVMALSYALRVTSGDVRLEVVSGAGTEAAFLLFEQDGGAPATAEEPTLELLRRLLEQQAGTVMTAAGGSKRKSVLGLRWPRLERLSVLVVDDNSGVIRLFTRYLSSHGYRVVGTESGSEAVQLAAAHRVGLVVLDVMMRQVDGWSVLQQLRAEPATCHIPILICSVLKEPQLALSLGATDVLTKPVSREQLLTAVARVAVK